MEFIHNGIKYKWDDEERYYTVLPNDYKGDITIPAYIQNAPVIHIASGAFFNCTELTAVTLPDTLEEIGVSAFENCCQLQQIYLPDSVERIGMYAFEDCSSLKRIRLPKHIHELPSEMCEDCTSLTEVIMPERVTIIDGAFHGCTSLQHITLPEGLKELGHGAFDGCTSLQEITLPSTLRQLGIFAFANCKQLQRIVVPEGVLYIPMGCFQGCTNLSDVQLPSTVLEIDSDALDYTAWMEQQEDGLVYYNDLLFTWKGTELPNDGYVVVREGTRIICDQALLNCPSLRSIVLPNTLRQIRQEAFSCTNLQYIVIPEGVEEIHSAAFEFCPQLQSIFIPSTVREIGINLFTGCKELRTIEVHSDNDYYDSRNVCNAIVCKKDNCLVAGCPNTQIPDSVESIGVGAFMDQPMPSQLIIPDSVLKIHRDAFSMCTTIQDISFSNRLTDIGDGAFEDTAWWQQQPAGAVYINDILYSYKPYPLDGVDREPDCLVRIGTRYIAEAAFRHIERPLRVILPDKEVKVHHFARAYVEDKVQILLPTQQQDVSQVENK